MKRICNLSFFTSLTIYFMFILVTSCKTEDPNKPLLLPVLTTTEVTDEFLNKGGEHNGYGCMSYDDFTYGDGTNGDMLYYNGKAVNQVEPASEVDKPEDTCVAGNNPDLWYKIVTSYGHSDCWEYVSSEDGSETSGDPIYDSCTFVDKYAGSNDGYGMISPVDGGNEYKVEVLYKNGHTDTDENGKVTTTYYDTKILTFKHNCQGGHTGYYCGGHLDVTVTGLVYHMTAAQRSQNHSTFSEKTTEDHPYKINKVLSDPDEDALNNAKDIFDIDCALSHKIGTTYVSFEGWVYDNMEHATSKLDDDWYSLYNIPSYQTVGGQTNSNALATPLSTTEISNILANLDTKYDKDPTWPARRSAVETALQYVGELQYDQGCHGHKLAVGASNDCSGYASQVWNQSQSNAFKGVIFDTQTFRNKMPHTTFSTDTAKPGDILIHGTADQLGGNGAHALVYLGQDKDGNIMTCDLSDGGAYYRSRGLDYYNQCTVLPMDKVLLK